MDQTRRRAQPSVGTIIVALLLGLLVLLILFPATVATSDPPVCHAMLFYVVPCEGRVAPLAAIAATVAVGIALWSRIDRREGDQQEHAR
jgi:type IV secretory pathway VirB2 component (pilin)